MGQKPGHSCKAILNEMSDLYDKAVSLCNQHPECAGIIRANAEGIFKTFNECFPK